MIRATRPWTASISGFAPVIARRLERRAGGTEPEGHGVAGGVVRGEEAFDRDSGEDVGIVDEERVVPDPRPDVLDAAAGFEEFGVMEERELCVAVTAGLPGGAGGGRPPASSPGGGGY